jgi:hypothetical protein
VTFSPPDRFLDCCLNYNYTSGGGEGEGEDGSLMDNNYGGLAARVGEMRSRCSSQSS